MIKQSHTQIRLLVAESFDLVRIGLRLLFKNHSTINLVAETNCLDDLFNLTLQHQPDVILLDLHLNNGNCTEYISRLLNICPQGKVLAFSQHDSEHAYLQIFRSGAAGVIGKHDSCKLLLKAIYAIHAGQVWFDRHITKLVRQTQFDPGSAQTQTAITASYQAKLSGGERRIAYLTCRGLSAKEISLQLLVTERTVRNQLSVIYRKIGVRKKIELYRKAFLYDYFQ